MKTFKVEVVDHSPVDIQANECLIGREGSLIFYRNNKVTHAFSAGQWKNVRLVEAASGQ